VSVSPSAYSNSVSDAQIFNAYDIYVFFKGNKETAEEEREENCRFSKIRRENSSFIQIR
jgi:hypothetical protein